MGMVPPGNEGWEPLGPYGGIEGEPWVYRPNPNGPILKIRIYSDEKEIRGMAFQSETLNGVVIGNPLIIGHIEDGRNPSSYRILIEEVCIDTSREQLVSLTVACDHQLRSLTFRTNLETRGPYGTKRRFPPPNPTADVDIELNGRVFVGFHGRLTGAGYPNAIGVYVTPPPTQPSPIPGMWPSIVVAFVCFLIYMIFSGRSKKDG